MGNRDLQEEVMDIICLSWRDTTTSQYELVLRQWKNYCRQKGVDLLFTDVKNVLDFFHGMYKRGCRLSGICAARSALSSAVTIPGYERTSNHPLISRYVKGIYNKHLMDIICLSWRDTTTSQYELVLRQWKNYCRQKGVDRLFTDVKNVLDFFHGMYKRGCRLSGICAARSALSSAVTIPGYERMSNHPLISRYVKGIYNKHPPLPKYVNTWDMNKLLTYYDNMGSNSELTFKQLCRKIAAFSCF